MSGRLAVIGGTPGSCDSSSVSITASARPRPDSSSAPAADRPAGMKSTAPPCSAVRPGPSPSKGTVVVSKSVTALIMVSTTWVRPPGPVPPILISPGRACTSASSSSKVCQGASAATVITTMPRAGMFTG
jgi:hypothetical protein